MKITVLFFAIARDQAGLSEKILYLAEGSSIDQAAHALATQFPKLSTRVAYAVNQSYAKMNTVLKDGDELAVIPPVSGG